MNNSTHHNCQKKVSLLACLFLLALQAGAQQFVFENNTLRAYELALNLETDEAMALLPEPESVADYYVISLAEAIALLVTEDAEKFSEYEDRFQARLEKKLKSKTADFQFLQAEMRLHWAFVYLKFGHEFDAALNLRQAYQIADACRKKNADYLPIKKTAGLIGVVLGSVPEKYNWVLGLMGLEGSIDQGLEDLETVRSSQHPLAFESDLLFCLIQGFILQKPEAGLAELKKMIAQKPSHKLALFLGASLAIKNSESEVALSMLDSINVEKGLPLYYADYLKGEVYLHKGDYLNSISSYRWFLNHHTGQNYIKDAWYKIGLCYWLNGNKNDALAQFKQARTKGREATEADKYAARSLAEKELPNVKLSKVRYATDGGYYTGAQAALDAIAPGDIPTRRDQVEFYYRKARLSHKQNQTAPAKIFYQQTIDMAGEESWYFAPNACLQMGYLLLAENKRSEAATYFQKALTYKKHEYKNSIDSKAKSALAQMKRK